ncbi:MAG: protein ImuB [Verrucomicrobiota bacterium]
MKGSKPGKAETENVQRSTFNAQRRIAEITTEHILGILHKWGIHILGQLAALDKEELRARLGNEAVTLWLRANGQANRLLKFVQPPETFEESFEFDHEIETAEPLLFILRRFLEQLALRLSSIYLVAKELTLTITFSNSQQVRYETDNSQLPAPSSQHERVFKIPQPTNDVDLLFRMLQTHLENFKSEHPIVAVALTARPIGPASQQFGLFETALRNPQQFYETLARLSALLGNERVGTPVLEETHRPDAFRMEPFDWVFGGTASVPSHFSSDTTERVPPGVKPTLRRFRPATAASIFTSEDRHLQSGNIAGKVIDQSGPFLFSGNWWDEKSWARAEWDMELENGELVRAHEDASPARTALIFGTRRRVSLH